jgi:hypothetical protein
MHFFVLWSKAISGSAMFICTFRERWLSLLHFLQVATTLELSTSRLDFSHRRAELPGRMPMDHMSLIFGVIAAVADEDFRGHDFVRPSAGTRQNNSTAGWRSAGVGRPGMVCSTSLS